MTTIDSRTAVEPMSAVYRPPLWSQNSAYSASDDRRLIAATLTPGVIKPGDLRVIPRQEGANMSVDVLPGMIAIEGTEQADQGSYLCALTQRVNVQVAAGPSAGSQRWDAIVARVSEPIDQPATWNIAWFGGSARADALRDFPPWPPSSVVLAFVGPIQSNTTQITEGMILDVRPGGQPPPDIMGELRTDLTSQIQGLRANTHQGWKMMGPIVASQGQPERLWDFFTVPITKGPRISFEGTVEGTLTAQAASQQTWGSVGLRVMAGSQGRWRYINQVTTGNMIMTSLITTCYFHRVVIGFLMDPQPGEEVRVEATVLNRGGSPCVFSSAHMTLRVNPFDYLYLY
jgi:hypothetical protein